MRQLIFVTIAATVLLGASKPESSPPPSESATPPAASAAGEAPEKNAETARQELPRYQLPLVGKPRRRVGGGMRRPGALSAEPLALAPAHVGRTVSTQPTLYWRLDGQYTPDSFIELTLADQDSIDPLIEVRADRPMDGALQRLSLADHGIVLDLGREYEWSVAIVSSGRSHSRDIVSTGWIELVAGEDQLVAQLASAKPDTRVALYARAGLWYDAVSEAASLMQSDPADADRSRLLAALLDQAGLGR